MMPAYIYIVYMQSIVENQKTFTYYDQAYFSLKMLTKIM